VAGGVVTFGNAAPPITIYNGSTGRKELKGPAGVLAGPPSPESHTLPDHADPGREGNSFGNISRGDWIRTSDLLNPIQAR
jgi:hypothetical protein